MTVPFCVGVAIMEKFVSPSANNYKAKSWNNIRDISKLKLSQKSQIGSFLSSLVLQIIKDFVVCLCFCGDVLCSDHFLEKSEHYQLKLVLTQICTLSSLNQNGLLAEFCGPMVKYFWATVCTWILTTLSILEFCNHVLFFSNHLNSKSTESCLYNISYTHLKDQF